MEAEAPADGEAGAGPAGYLRTILTYNLPSEAEVDKAYLESNGIAVCLLNANTSRNELGAPFYVRLQVMDRDVEAACSLIKETNPRRFGSIERVNDIERQIRRTVIRFAAVALPMGIAVGLATYLLSAGLPQSQPMYIRRFWVTPNMRVELAIAVGLAASVVGAAWSGRPGK